MAFYLHSTYNVAAVKKLSREKDIFWQTFCTECRFLPAATGGTNGSHKYVFKPKYPRRGLSTPVPMVLEARSAGRR